jgi:hypothetical protein
MSQKTWQPRAKTRKQLGVHTVTITRWEADPRTGFPKPRVINSRKYDCREDVEAWMARRDEVAA